MSIITRFLAKIRISYFISYKPRIAASIDTIFNFLTFNLDSSSYLSKDDRISHSPLAYAEKYATLETIELLKSLGAKKEERDKLKDSPETLILLKSLEGKEAMKEIEKDEAIIKEYSHCFTLNKDKSGFIAVDKAKALISAYTDGYFKGTINFEGSNNGIFIRFKVFGNHLKTYEFTMSKYSFYMKNSLGEKKYFSFKNSSSHTSKKGNNVYYPSKKVTGHTNTIKLTQEDLVWLSKNKVVTINFFENKKFYNFTLSKIGQNNIQLTSRCFLKYLNEKNKISILDVKASNSILQPFQSKENNLWGYTNQMGDVVIPCQFTIAPEFKYRIALACHHLNGYYWIDKTGNKVLDYNHLRDFNRVTPKWTILKNHNFFKVSIYESRHNKMYHEKDFFVKKDGKLLQNLNSLVRNYETYIHDEHQTHTIIRSGSYRYSNTTVVDKDGNVIFKNITGSFYFFSRKYNNHLYHNLKAGFNNSYCAIYHAIGSYKGSRKHGLVDRQGYMILPPVYSSLRFDSKNNYVIAKKRGESDLLFFLNSQRKEYSKDYVPCGDMIIFQDKNGNYGYFNSKSESIAISPQFDEARCFDNDSNLAYVKKNGREFYIDKMGNFAGTIEEINKSN